MVSEIRRFKIKLRIFVYTYIRLDILKKTIFHSAMGVSRTYTCLCRRAILGRELCLLIGLVITGMLI